MGGERRRRAPPPGLDYVPIPGRNPDLIFGVIRSTLGGVANTALEAVFKRIFPVNRPKDPYKPWPKSTCYKPDVVLPLGAPNDYMDPEVLCRAYDKQGWASLKDLIVITTLRFPETVSDPPTLTLPEAYEKARAFAFQRLALERRLAVVIAFHVPGHAGVEANVPHCHLMALARTCSAIGFSGFAPNGLPTDAGRKVMDDEWEAWCSSGPAVVTAMRKPPAKRRKKQ